MTTAPSRWFDRSDVTGPGRPGRGLQRKLATPYGAYTMALSVWFTYLVLPVFVFLGVVVYLLIHRPAASSAAGGSQAWFYTMMILLAGGVPLVFLMRSRWFFYGYTEGRRVTPHQYFVGMVMVWSWIELVGLLSILGCAITAELAPNIIPALIAFVLFLTQWPNASALLNETGNLEDPSLYLHAR